MPLRRRLFSRLQQFIFVWPGDENLQVGFNGDVIIVPPRDQPAIPGPGSPYRFEGVKDKLGQIIPGTVAISDRIDESGPGRGYVKLFDAAECCAWLEDTREDLFNRGFAIVMETDDISAAMEEGRPKYEASQDELAREILASELERRKRWDAKGVPPPPSSSDHKIRWAVAHLEARAKETPMLSEDAIKRVLSGTMVESLPPLTSTEHVKAKEMLGSVPKAEASTELPVTELFQMAEAAGIKLTKPEMGKLLTNDVEFRRSLIEQIAEKQEGERVGA